MRGRPIIEWLIFMAFWLCLLVPMRLLTSGDSATVVEAAETADVDRRPVWATVRFSEPPIRFRLIQDARVLWEAEPTAQQALENEFTLELYQNSADVMVEVWWEAPGKLKAVELVLEPDELVVRSRTLWHRSDVLREAVTFQW